MPVLGLHKLGQPAVYWLPSVRSRILRKALKVFHLMPMPLGGSRIGSLRPDSGLKASTLDHEQVKALAFPILA